MTKFVRDNRFFDSNEKPPFFVYLLVLNQPVHKEMFVDLHSRASLLLCADGGANRIYHAFDTSEERAQFRPDVIIGDLDSVEEEVCKFFEEHGTRVYKNPNQDTTDLEKSLQYVLENSESLSQEHKKDSIEGES